MTCPDGCATAPRLSRRRLLQGVGFAVAASTLTSTRLAFASTPAADQRTLVVLSLRGGFDGLTAVAPVGDPDYQRLRPSIAVPQRTALQVDSIWGLHPALAPLMPLWQAGEFGAVHAVGQPDPTRSHFQAMEEIERAAPGTSVRTGWLDRLVGITNPSAPIPAAAVGSHVPFALAGPSPELGLDSLDGFGLSLPQKRTDPRFEAALKTMWAGRSGAGSRALGSLRSVEAVCENTTASSAKYPGAGAAGHDLGRALQDVSRLVKAGTGLSVACLDYGHWDYHAGLGAAGTGSMARQLSGLANALSGFVSDLGQDWRKVTVVTMSEFGRRVAENASGGVDHGHGNSMLFLGTALAGGRVHGTWSGLSRTMDTAGDLAATTDYRDVLVELTGLKPDQAGQIFPRHAVAALGLRTV